ncbi:MAG: 50S ribosome-binding GTPase, partial [Deinococcus sp.]|nr:50S ribosome-binding GTPase [Deinococcus sp.]
MPKVSIVGRPSVGKSTLFNRLVGRRQAIVADTPGVTRDVAEAVVSDVKDYLLRDTGGLASGDQWETPIHRQVERALADSELVLFLVDGRVSTTAADYEVAELLRRASKPVLLLATKIDDPRHAYYLGELWGLGFGEPIPISALHDQGIDELRQKITGLLPEGEGLDPAQPIKLAIMGRPNVG